MTLFAWGFEGQSDTVGVSVANSATFGDPVWSNVSAGGFLTYSTAQAFIGTVSVLVNVTTAATATTMDKSDTASASAATHFYVYMTAYPTVDAQGPVAHRGGAAAQCRVQITSTGQLRNFAGGTTGTASTGTMSLNTWYRVESVTTGAGTAATQITTNVYAGNSTTVLFAVPAVSGATTTAQIDLIRWTKSGGNTTISYHLDDPRQNIGSAVEIGPTLTDFPFLPFLLPRRRVSPPRRARMEVVQPPPVELAPPASRGARRQFRPVRRGVEVIAPPPQVVVPPGRVFRQVRNRRFAVLARRGVEQTFVPAPAATPVAPPAIPTALKGRRVGRLSRRGRVVGPVPVQAVAPVAPAVAPPGPRVRRVQTLLRRRPPVVVVPVQLVAPVNPPMVFGPARVRRLVAAVLRRPRSVPAAGSGPDRVPPVPAGRRRPVPSADRRRGANPVIVSAPVAPAPAPRPVRRRLLGLLRRGPGREVLPVQPGNPNTLIPRPGTVEPGTRTGPSAGGGSRGGPGVGPGVRSSVSGVPGVRGGGDNEPGTRSGPTISGGQ